MRIVSVNCPGLITNNDWKQVYWGGGYNLGDLILNCTLLLLPTPIKRSKRSEIDKLWYSFKIIFEDLLKMLTPTSKLQFRKHANLPSG